MESGARCRLHIIRRESVPIPVAVMMVVMMVMVVIVIARRHHIDARPVIIAVVMVMIVAVMVMMIVAVMVVMMIPLRHLHVVFPRLHG